MLSTIFALVALLALIAGCGSSAPAASRAGPLATYTLGNALAEDDHDQSEAAELDRIVDKLTAGTTLCAPTTDRVATSQVIENSWKASNRSGTLLAFARGMLTACGG